MYEPQRSTDQLDVFANDARFRAIVETTADGFWAVDQDGQLLYVNDVYVSISGYSRAELLQMRVGDLDASESPEETRRHLEKIVRSGSDIFETLHRAKDGTLWQAEISTSFCPENGGLFFVFIRDIRRHRRSESLLRTRYRLSELANRGELDELMRAVLDEAELFTGSRIGFFHIVNPDQEHLTLTAWSTNTLENLCKTTLKGSHYPIKAAGAWVDCFHQRKPVVHNDYASLKGRKGLPEGHVPVVRELTVPIVRNGQVQALLGVGNKTVDYTSEDIDIVEELASVAFDLVTKKRAEADLVGREIHYRLLMDNSSDWVACYDGESRILFASEACRQLIGFDPGELLGTNGLDLVHPEDRERIIQAMQRLFSTGEEQAELYRARTRDGDYIWVETRGRVLENGWNGAPALVGVTRDFSWQKRYEEDLKRQQTVLEAINHAQQCYISNASLQEVFNTLLTVLLQLTESEYGFIGEVRHSPTDGSPYLKTYALTNIAWNEETRNFYSQHAPRGLEFYNLKTLFGATLSSGKVTIANDPQNDPHRGGLPEGHPPLRTFLGLPLHVGDRMIGMAGVANRPGGYDAGLLTMIEPLLSTIAGIIQATQIDQLRLQAVEGLRESKERTQLLLDSAAEGIVGIDACGICIFCNASSLELLGYADESELIGRKLHDLFHCDAEEKMLDPNLCQIIQALETGANVHLASERLRRADNRCITAELWSHPIRRGAAISGAVISFIDISDRKALEEQNLRSTQLASVGELAAGVAHEINNPITGIINYAQLLLNRTPLSVSPDEILQRIIKEGDRIAGIVRALLHLSRDTRGECGLCRLDEIVGNVLILVLAQFEKNGISIDCRIESPLPVLFANSQQLEQMLLNLLHNSLYALNEKFPAEPQGKRLEISVERAVSAAGLPACRLSVFDNGTGIPAHLLTKVTNPFVTTKPAGAGTGLGLSLCQEIVSRHGGTLQIDSVEREFTRMIVTLPVAAEQSAASA